LVVRWGKYFIAKLKTKFIVPTSSFKDFSSGTSSADASFEETNQNTNQNIT